MTPEQQTRVESVFAELKHPRTHLHHKVTSDLLSGSVKMGKITRRNPPVLKGELEEALSEMYLGLCKLSWPWWWNVNETTANIMACKAVALQVLTRRRIRANRKAIEADLSHHLLVEGNAPVLRGDEGETMEVQDTFCQEDNLDVRSTKMVPPDPGRKSLNDYRKISPIKAKCHPIRGHYAKGWCNNCYKSLARKHKIAPPPYSPDVVVNARALGSPTATSRLLTKIAKTRGGAPTARCYEGLGFWGPTFTEEWMKTLRATTPIDGNQYTHASLIRGLNRLSQTGRLTLWRMQVLTHNQGLVGMGPDE